MARAVSTRLGEDQQAAYRERGYCSPLRAFDPMQAARLRERFEAHRTRHAPWLSARLPREQAEFLVENHLFLRWVYEIVVNPLVLDAVESVLGPDVLVWSSQWFPKMPHDGSFVSWHQDAAYWVSVRRT